MQLRLGIDVGGTNTDAVIMDETNHLLAKAKTPVTPDVMSGIKTVVARVVADAGVDPSAITQAMLGTTQVTNAIIERKGLSRVGILRLGAPATQAIAPLAAWPDDLKAAVEGPWAILPGGYEYDGRPISPFDETQVLRFLDDHADEVQAFAVSSVFSPVRADDEQRVAQLIEAHLQGRRPVSLSHEIGSIGLLERENATILNAAVTQVARRVVHAFQEALEGLSIHAQLFLSQNDGTLMSLEYALRYPILTVACGPTNSIRGAAFLSGVRDALVVDVGGTSTDVGVLSNGFPRESALAVEVGGVRTNFRMPDLISIGLGGGSIVRISDEVDSEEIQIGPQSVGYRVATEAQCFGGSTLTMTDVAVARGMADLGNPDRIQLTPSLAERIFARSKAMVEEAIDRMKSSAAPVPVIAVGGGSILLPDQLAGVSQLIRPQHYEVANAVGAAIAQVSGTVDRIFSLDQQSRESALEEAKKAAMDEATRAGGDPQTLEIISVEEVPLAYLPSNAVRIKVKAAGQLKHAEG